MTNNEKFDDTFKLTWYEEITFGIKDFINNWIYPAYTLQNILINRYDLVRLPRIKRTSYIDTDERMYQANMELVKTFIEKAKPEKYVCWYKDNASNDVGPKYIEKDSNETILFPELKGKWIMDIVKDIYNWYIKESIELNNDKEYISSIRYNYFYNSWFEKDNENSEYLLLKHDEKIYSDEELNKLDIDWNRILKYTTEKNIKDIANSDELFKISNNISQEIFNKKQYYLHLCIEVRPYLWI